MTGPISRNRLLGSLKEAASWPEADRNTVVTLATTLVAARADTDGSRYFQDLSEQNPTDATAQALAGFFAVRAGHDEAGQGRDHGLRPATVLPRAGPGRAAARRRPVRGGACCRGYRAGGPGDRRPGVRARGPGPVPGLAAPRRVPGP